MEQKPGQQQKGRMANIQAIEMKFLRVILNKIMEYRIRNTNIRLELGVPDLAGSDM